MARTNRSIAQYGDVNKTAVVEARCDVRSLAGCYRYLQKKEYIVNSKSDLIRSVIDIVYNDLVLGGEIDKIDDFDVATAVLSPLGYTSRDNKGARHISMLMNRQDFSTSSSSSIDIGLSPERLAEARKILADRLDHPEKYISDPSCPSLSPEAQAFSFDPLGFRVVEDKQDLSEINHTSAQAKTQADLPDKPLPSTSMEDISEIET